MPTTAPYSPAELREAMTWRCEHHYGEDEYCWQCNDAAWTQAPEECCEHGYTVNEPCAACESQSW